MLQSGICTYEEEDIVDNTVQQCYRVGYVLMRKKILLTNEQGQERPLCALTEPTGPPATVTW